MAVDVAPCTTATPVAEVRQAILDGVGRIFDVSPECFDQQAPSAFGIFRWSIEKAHESPGVHLNEIIADLPEKQVEKQKVLQFLVDYHEKKKLYRKQVKVLLCLLMESPNWRHAGLADSCCEELKTHIRKLTPRHCTDCSPEVALESVSWNLPPHCADIGGSCEDGLMASIASQCGSEECGGEVLACSVIADWKAGTYPGCDSPRSPQDGSDLPHMSPTSKVYGWIENCDRQVDSLTMVSREMHQELAGLKTTVDLLKTRVLTKMETAIHEVLECHDAHAKDHAGITDKLTYLEHRVDVAEDVAANDLRKVPQPGCHDENAELFLLARIECLEATVALPMEQYDTIISRLETIEKVADPTFSENLSKQVERLQCLVTTLHQDFIRERDKAEKQRMKVEEQVETVRKDSTETGNLLLSLRDERASAIEENLRIEDLVTDVVGMQEELKKDLEEGFARESRMRDMQRNALQHRLDSLEKRFVGQTSLQEENSSRYAFIQRDRQLERRRLSPDPDVRIGTESVQGHDADTDFSPCRSREPSPTAPILIARQSSQPRFSPPQSPNLVIRNGVSSPPRSSPPHSPKIAPWSNANQRLVPAVGGRMKVVTTGSRATVPAALSESRSMSSMPKAAMPRFPRQGSGSLHASPGVSGLYQKTVATASWSPCTGKI